MLPDFLEPLDRKLPGQPSAKPTHINAVFRQREQALSSHVLWWPSSTGNTDTILLFIPGNPGLVDFYTPFLTSIHDKTSGSLPILARAHLAHTPNIDGDKSSYKDSSAYCLTAQIESVLELLDAIRSSYRRIIIAAHSVGTWITMQILKKRPDAIECILLLFPTISHIRDTPNGRKLSWLFQPPFPRLVSYASTLTWFLPTRFLSLMFPDWPAAQLQVLQTLLSSPACIHACLSMAHDEMVAIRELDITQLHESHERIYMFYGEKDDWVGAERELVRRALGDDSHVTVVQDSDNIPHSFCIAHHETLAQQCIEWLISRALL